MVKDLLNYRFGSKMAVDNCQNIILTMKFALIGQAWLFRLGKNAYLILLADLTLLVLAVLVVVFGDWRIIDL
jgi:hypothetical protein